MEKPRLGNPEQPAVDQNAGVDEDGDVLVLGLDTRSIDAEPLHPRVRAGIQAEAARGIPLSPRRGQYIVPTQAPWSAD